MPKMREGRAPSHRHLVIVANPSPGSFCHAVAATYMAAVDEAGDTAVVRDLYAARFDPVLRREELPGRTGWQPATDVAAEFAHVRAADVLVLVYPIWFGMPPAILKGYVDRVLGAGQSLARIEAGVPHAVSGDKPLLSIGTAGLSPAWLHAHGQDQAVHDGFVAYLRYSLGLTRGEHLAIEEVCADMPPPRAAAALARVREAAMRTSATLAGHPPPQWEA